MKDELRGAWAGATVVCAASGPSLRQQDLDLVRGKAKLIVVNTTFRLALWADALYAMDTPWWRTHKDELGLFTGLRCGLNYSCAAHGATPMAQRQGFLGGNHSGAGAIALAMHLGASRILLTGYDGKPAASGRVHWHEDHPKPLGNGGSMKSWPHALRTLADAASKRNATIYNCSRNTVYEQFPRGELASMLVLESLAR